MARPTYFSLSEFPADTVSRWRERIDPDGPVHPTLGTACHLWTGTRLPAPENYGTLRRGRINLRAHRIAWMVAHGDIPPEMHVLHRCVNPPCVNVDHLFLGTHEDNMHDKQRKGRAALVLTEADVLAIREATGERAADIGARYGITGTMVNVIRRGEKWDHVGGPRSHPGKHPPPPTYKPRLSPEETTAAIVLLLPEADRGGSRRHPEKPFKWQAIPALAERLGVHPSMVYQTLRSGATTDLLAKWRAALEVA